MKIDIDKFLNECGFHDNRIVSIELKEPDLYVNIDDLYANVADDNKAEIPAIIKIIGCDTFSCDYLVSNWITDGRVIKAKDEVTLVLSLNTGATLQFTGKKIEIETIDG
jgi:hypothetical protein